MRAAIVINNIVTNIVSLYRITDLPNAIDCHDKPVAVGDTYQDGKFYRDGEEVMSENEEYKQALELLGIFDDDEEQEEETE